MEEKKTMKNENMGTADPRQSKKMKPRTGFFQ